MRKAENAVREDRAGMAALRGGHYTPRMTTPPLGRALALPALAALLSLLPGTVVGSDTPAGFDIRAFVCPIDGKPFSQDIGYPSLVLVQFPDGSWLGDAAIDAQIPECPGNGLVLIPDFDGTNDGTNESSRLTYRDYTPAQQARLPALIASEAYRALGKQGRYERALWLAQALNLSAWTRWQLMVRGSWATIDPVERRRRVTRIAEAGPALIDALEAPGPQKLGQRLLVANALRELGRFEAALAMLDAIVAGIPQDADLRDPDNVRALHGSIARMRTTIEHRDDDRFPVDLSYEKWASRVCADQDLPAPYGPMTANAKAACARREREREADRAVSEEASRLQEDPQALARRCETTPEQSRSPALAQACWPIDFERDRKAGEAMVLRQPRRVAADCEATPQMERDGALRSACSFYDGALERALQERLIEDDAAYAIICQDGRTPPDRAGFADMACAEAERLRNDRAVAALLADPTALDAACAPTAQGDRGLPLSMACAERSRNLFEADVKRLAGDGAAYAAACDGVVQPDSPYVELNRTQTLCAAVEDAIERNAENAAMTADEAAAVAAAEEAIAEIRGGNRPAADNDATDIDAVFAPDSELNAIAREAAERIIATARAERTYPKYRRGDLY
jgi:hypothetical protein